MDSMQDHVQDPIDDLAERRAHDTARDAYDRTRTRMIEMGADPKDYLPWEKLTEVGRNLWINAYAPHL